MALCSRRQTSSECVDCVRAINYIYQMQNIFRNASPNLILPRKPNALEKCSGISNKINIKFKTRPQTCKDNNKYMLNVDMDQHVI
jgi:hypothetical protein